MKQKLRIRLHKINALQIALAIFVLGLIIGIVIAHIFQNDYKEQMSFLEDSTFQIIQNNQFQKYDLFIYTLGNRLKPYVIFWLLSITILGIPYMIYKVFYTGYMIGFFISVMILQYGISGIVLCLAYIFPQYLIYIPVALMALRQGYQLNHEMNKGYHGTMKVMLRRMAHQLIPILIGVLLIGVGSFLESYLGVPILKKAISFVLK